MKIILLLLLLDILGIIPFILTWRKDCQVYGKDNVAVPLKKRIIDYVLTIMIPSIIGILVGCIINHM